VCRPLGRCNHKWDYNVKLSPNEIGFKDVDCICDSGERLAGFWKHGNEPLAYINGETHIRPKNTGGKNVLLKLKQINAFIWLVNQFLLPMHCTTAAEYVCSPTG
jgi:hypothetical protein